MRLSVNSNMHLAPDQEFSRAVQGQALAAMQCPKFGSKPVDIGLRPKNTDQAWSDETKKQLRQAHRLVMPGQSIGFFAER